MTPSPSPSPQLIEAVSEPASFDLLNAIITIAAVILAAALGYVFSYLTEGRRIKNETQRHWDALLLEKASRVLTAADALWYANAESQIAINRKYDTDGEVHPDDGDIADRATAALAEWTAARNDLALIAPARLSQVVFDLSARYRDIQVKTFKVDPLPPASPDSAALARFMVEARMAAHVPDYDMKSPKDLDDLVVEA